MFVVVLISLFSILEQLCKIRLRITEHWITVSKNSLLPVNFRNVCSMCLPGSGSLSSAVSQLNPTNGATTMDTGDKREKDSEVNDSDTVGENVPHVNGDEDEHTNPDKRAEKREQVLADSDVAQLQKERMRTTTKMT